MNNYEKIKNMTLDEMAEFFSNLDNCEYCMFRKYCSLDIKCKELHKLWLEKEIN
ncbi:MAG: hypothetical protein ACI4S3_06035 [Candidatus Gastranaerophilaceae bacterium]